MTSTVARSQLRLLLAVLLLGYSVASPVQPEDGDDLMDSVELAQFFDTEPTLKPDPDKDGGESEGGSKQLDPWSLVWYIGSFGGLVAFFLAVSCSECCCHKPAAGQTAASGGSGDQPPRLPAIPEGPPPPPYSMFAPPPYDSLCYDLPAEKDKVEVFVVPVPVHNPNLTPSSQPP